MGLMAELAYAAVEGFILEKGVRTFLHKLPTIVGSNPTKPTSTIRRRDGQKEFNKV